MDISRHSYPAEVVLPMVHRANGLDNCGLLTTYHSPIDEELYPLTEQKDILKVDLSQLSHEDLYALAQTLMEVSCYFSSRGIKVHAKKSVDASNPRQTTVFS